MSKILKLSKVEDHIIRLRNQNVIIDSDVAALYGVETKRVNEAVKNNPDKFPQGKGYIFELDSEELTNLRSKFSTANISPMSRTAPKAFTEKGLYMLATILKSDVATATTLEIIETFAKLRELTRTVAEIAETQDKATQKSLMQKSGELFADLMDNNLEVTGSETTVEINLAMMKIKHTVKKEKKK
ncbi:MAG: ORF6N domain-containing protein [Dysgonamonadaceae bacterium]|jgi:hypothetical protein|nr:ORF6N domain-containing protein [Dysgonamonadaceae bacterium]